MSWFLMVGVIAITGIGICWHLAHNGSDGAGLWTPGKGWSGIEFAPFDDDGWITTSTFDEDDMYYSPVYDHMPCNVWCDPFKDDGTFSSSDDDSSSMFDDWSSLSMFDDDFGCSSWDD